MEPKGNKYEVVILGSGLSGLIAGTLLSTQNHSVLLLTEKGSKPYFEKEGYRFIPFSNFSEKILKSSLLPNVSKRLGLLPIGEKRGPKNEKGKKERVAFQVILPKSRIDLYQDILLLKKELRREFPEEMLEVEKFYGEMARIGNSIKRVKTHEPISPPLPMREKSLIKNRFYLEQSPFSKEFKRFLQLQWIPYGNLHSDWIPISFLAFHLLNEETDEGVEPNDLEILKNQIFKKFLHSGGRAEEIVGVDRIEMGWRKGMTLSLKGEKREVHAHILVFNSPLNRLSPLLGEKRKKISKFEEKIQTRYLLIPIFLGVQEKVVPVGMRDLLISLLDLEKPFENGNLLYISLSPKGDESMAPEGRRALIAEGWMSLEKWNQGLFDQFREGVLNHLKRLIPFLEDHLEFIDWGWALEEVPRWSYSHFIYEPPDEFNWRDGVIPTRISKNLYLIGKENFPYLGLEGELLSGLKVGDEILKRFH
ncbi:MAG: hypothetical protein ACPL6D_02135 [Thermodesulfobacteriota bacterium]